MHLHHICGTSTYIHASLNLAASRIGVIIIDTPAIASGANQKINLCLTEQSETARKTDYHGPMRKV
jgi:hypothetical protein